MGGMIRGMSARMKNWVFGIWFAQGRPEGAERDLLRLLGSWYRPAFLARLVRPSADPR